VLVPTRTRLRATRFQDEAERRLGYPTVSVAGGCGHAPQAHEGSNRFPTGAGALVRLATPNGTPGQIRTDTALVLSEMTPAKLVYGGVSGAGGETRTRTLIAAGFKPAGSAVSPTPAYWSPMRGSNSLCPAENRVA
jgi:hypothetical protein